MNLILWVKINLFKQEIWKNIKFPYDNYRVSTKGRIKNKEGKILIPIKCRFGYLRIRMSYKGKMKAFSINRLVLETFRGENPELDVNHKNRTKINNELNNLEYLTKSENQRHWRNIEKKKRRKLNENTYYNFNMDRIKYYIYDCIIFKIYKKM